MVTITPKEKHAEITSVALTSIKDANSETVINSVTRSVLSAASSSCCNSSCSLRNVLFSFLYLEPLDLPPLLVSFSKVSLI